MVVFKQTCAETNAEGYSPVINWMNDVGSAPEDMAHLPDKIGSNTVRCFQNYEVGVLVSDMSGFTKLTRKHGAVHFTSIIARNRQICHPILRRNGACFIATEGDNFIVVFPTVVGAALAACEMQQTVTHWNNGLSPEREHFALTLNGVGVHCGKGPIVDICGKLHGKTSDNAYTLGEEMCDKGSVAFSQAVVDKIKGATEFAGANFRPHALKEDADDELKEAVHSMGCVYELDWQQHDAPPVVDVEDDRYVRPALLPFAKRHSRTITDEQLKAVDEEMTKAHMKQRSVLMFEFEYENADDPDVRLGLKFECLSSLDRIFTNCNAHGLEDVLYTFEDPCDAVWAAISMRRCVDSVKIDGGSRPRVSIRGFGVHTGDILYLPGTDVHWGDPVNTSSKLGQDTAKNGELIISERVYEECKADERLQEMSFEQFEIMKSGVAFKCYKVCDDTTLKDRILKQWLRYAEDSKVVSRAKLTILFKLMKPTMSESNISTLLDAGSVPHSGTIDIEAFLTWALD